MSLSKLHRIIYLSLGGLFVALGLLGAFLPVLPTTPFLLLALWAFARSSERLHSWLLHHPRFGPTLQAWEQSRTIPLRIKIFALVMMAASLAVIWFSAEIVWAAKLGATLIIAIGVGYVLSSPSETTGPAVEQKP